MADLITLKVEKLEKYAVLDLTAEEDPNLSWKAKGLHTYLVTRPPGWQIYRNELERRSTDGRESLANGLRELKAAGYLEIVPAQDEKGKMNGWVWTVRLVPIMSEKKPKPVGRETRNTENPSSGKPAPNINQEENNKQENKIPPKPPQGGADSFEEKVDFPEQNSRRSRKRSGKITAKSLDREYFDQRYGEKFERVKNAYPPHARKNLDAARAALQNRDPSDQDVDIWVKAIEAQKDEKEAMVELKKREPKTFIPNWPHLSTWINEGRFGDEVVLPAVSGEPAQDQQEIDALWFQAIDKIHQTPVGERPDISSPILVNILRDMGGTRPFRDMNQFTRADLKRQFVGFYHKHRNIPKHQEVSA